MSYRKSHVGMVGLCRHTINICIGGQEVWTPDFREDNMLAFQHHGIVFVQNAVFHQTLDLQSCFVHLLPGAIIAEGEEKMKIYIEPLSVLRTESKTHPDRQVHELFTPVDSFPGISFSTRLKTSGESIYLQQNALVQDRIYAIPSPGSISGALGRLYVTKDCDHRYYDTTSAAEIDRIAAMLRTDRIKHAKKEHSEGVLRMAEKLKVKQGLFLAGAEYRSSIFELWLQAVDQNGPGQWLAYQDLDRKDYFTVLQRGCCTACALKMVLASYAGEYSRGKLRFARIIHGRLAGEDME